MIFPVKRVKEELINEFAVSNMTIENFSKVHSIQPEALKSWIQEKMYKSQHPESESTDIFQASEFVELDIPHASKHQITVGIDRKELITVRAAGIEGAVFMFCNSQRKLLKLIWWETNGFWIAQKTLEKGRWPWPDTVEQAREIKLDEVIMLLNGIDFFCAYEPLKYEQFD